MAAAFPIIIIRDLGRRDRRIDHNATSELASIKRSCRSADEAAHAVTHHHGSVQLFLNDDGVLRLADVPFAANASAPGLFRSAFDAEAAATAPGLYLWHDTNPGGAWQFLWLDPEGDFDGFTADLETSLGYGKTTGLAQDELVVFVVERYSIWNAIQ